MTDIEKKALALVNEVEGGNWLPHETDRIRNFATICRAIEQHEAFKHEVSDAVEFSIANYEGLAFPRLTRFIIAKPDPLVEVISSALREGSPFDEDLSHDYTAEAKVIAAAIRASGLEVRKIGEGE